MGRRAAHRLDDPGRQVGEVLGHPPGSGGRAGVGPGELGEARPFVIDEILDRMPGARFEHNDIHSLLGQFIAKRSAAGARANDDNHIVVIEIEFRSHGPLPNPVVHNQSRSSKPRWM
jgi:hypothetical protein